jgi:hypothetical protein
MPQMQPAGRPHPRNHAGGRHGSQESKRREGDATR